MTNQQLKISSPEGIYGQIASSIVNKASQFTSTIMIQSNGKEVDLKSIFGIMSLSIRKDTIITITADGFDEEEAILKLTEKLINENLAEIVKK